MHRLRLALWLLGGALLAACGSAEPKWASDAEVARSVYRSEEPASLTIYTVLSTGSGSGAHTGLVVNAPSQRALFDPAGTFYHPHLPERNDVHFGMSDPAIDFYIDYHARVTYDVVEQTILVSPQVAELALARIQAYGAVPKARCTVSTTDILAGLPGFEGVPRTMFPKQLMKWIDTLPNVERTVHSDDSPDENGRLVQAPPLLLKQS